jgi:hypothetical protein
MTVFLDVTPCSLVQIDRRFGGTYFLHFQGYVVSQKYYHRGDE